MDDDDDFRDSVEALLKAWGWRVSSFCSAIHFAQQWRSLKPGPVLLDVRMPGMGGLDLLEQGDFDLKKFPAIVVTGHGDIQTAVRCLKAGAIDFLEKPFSSDDLVRSLEGSVSEAGAVISKGSSRAQTLSMSLTERELSVLKGIVAGYPYKVIAHQLHISTRTVEMHRNKLLRRLGVRTNGEAVRLAVLAGIEPA